MDVNYVNRIVSDLNAIMIGRVERLITLLRADRWEDANGNECRYEFFEGFRHPARQADLIANTKNTKARPWESAHNYGLAADFAVRVSKRATVGYDTEWSWSAEHPWGKVKQHAFTAGLVVPIKWDPGHVEHPLFPQILKIIRQNS